MSATRRQILKGSLGLATVAAMPGLVRAQTADTVRFIAGFAPGGTVDTLARRVAHSLTGKLAPSVVVENRTGAGGQIAVQATARSAPDGRTVLTTPMSMLGLYPHTYSKLPYDPFKDVEPVSMGCEFVFGFAVGPAVPESVKTVQDFWEWCRADPRRATYGSPGAGSVPHFVGALIGRAGGLDFQHAAFRGTQPAILDMIGGQIPAVSGPVGEFLPHLEGGKVRIIATSGAERTRFAPDVPTLAEQGLKDLVFSEWFGFYVPAGTPKAEIDKLNKYIREALKTSEVIDGLATMGLEAKGSTPEELRERLAADTKQWGEIVKAIGFTAES